MKKKKIIVIFLVVILIIGLLSGFLIKKNLDQKKQLEIEKHQELIANTKKEYEFYLKNEILKNCKNETQTQFNQVNIEQQKNQKINFAVFVTTLFKDPNVDINTLNQAIENELKQYDSKVLTSLTKETISSDEKLDQKTLLELYKNHTFIKNLEKETKKREEYVTQLNTLKQELEYFLDNDLYYIQNNEYFCKNDEIWNRWNEFNQKYNLNLKISKEPIVIQKKQVEVPILCYHGVLDNPWGIQSLFVKVNEFEAQMNYLKEAGYTPIFTSEIATASNYEKPVIITFDDGYKDVYTNAFPILKKYNLKANVYMISAWINGDVYMTTDMTKEMSSSPLIEIGSHTVSHKALATLSTENIEYELRESKRTLEEMLNKQMTVIAYPTGSFDDRVISIASKYYQYGLSTINGREDPNNLNTYTLRRIYVYRSYNLDQFKKILP